MDLTIILAGPILRRTEATKVHVWLVTSKPVELQLDIFDDTDLLGSNQLPDGFHKVAQLGQKLYVHLLRAVAEAESFPTNTLLEYELSVDGKALNDPELLGDLNLSYPGRNRPAFVIAADNSTLLYGSCRKPHAYSDKDLDESLEDGLATLDRWMAGRADDPNQRPAALFLCGDQIYADDVAGPLLYHLMPLARELSGTQERLPGRGRYRSNSLDPSEIELYNRARFFNRKNAGFSSGESKNHLATFAEYAAMYLSVWGGVPLQLTGLLGVQDNILEGFAHIGENAPQPHKHQTILRRYEQELEQLEAFSQTLPRVRRLLANVPVYMTADDHDVTDDWYINPDWRKTALGIKRGRRVISNALAAYWAFQAWGNDPDAFDEDFIQSLEAHLQQLTIEGQNAQRYEDTLLNHQPGWGFVAPTQPAVISLDTRTRRQANGAADGPAQLLDAAAINEFEQQARALLEQSNKHLVLISATPVLGFKPVEFLQRKFGGLVPVTTLDFESWSADPQGLNAFMDALEGLQPASCLVLSGDVHYSMVRQPGERDRKPGFPLWQCCSSPLMNLPTAKFALRPLSELNLGMRSDYIFPEQDTERRVVSDSNAGVVRFVAGKPISHRLILANRFQDGEQIPRTFDYQLS